MQSLRLGFMLAVVMMAAGCAHQMTMRADVAGLALPAGATPIPKKTGLYISPEKRAKEVTTSGGGGDKVSYRPYADMETGLYKVFGNTFQNVDLLSTLSDVNSIAKHSLTLIAIPEITTTSSSNGVFTWMATDFSTSTPASRSRPLGTVIRTW